MILLSGTKTIEGDWYRLTEYKTKHVFAEGELFRSNSGDVQR